MIKAELTQRTLPAEQLSNHPPPIEVKYRRLDSLRPDPDNPRSHSASQIRRLAKAIDRFGFLGPIVVDKDCKIILGEGRWRAAQLLEFEQVPTIQITHLSTEECQALMIADNRLPELGSWNEPQLGKLLKRLVQGGLQLDVELTGFDMAEIDLRIGALDLDVGQNAPEFVPDIAVGDPISKPGDLWQLGRHRVLCADALDGNSYVRLMSGKRAAMVFTDPPYNVRIDGHATGNGKVRHREFAMASGEMDPVQFVNFLSSYMRLVILHSTDGALHFHCMDWRHTHELLSAALELYAELKNICVWVKHSAGLGSLYRSQHEFVFVFKNGKDKHRNNVQLGRFGRNRTNVWSYPGVNVFGRGTEDGNLLALHPTVKPIALIADAVLDCSARGDVILDPFLGSGSTLLAAERIGRCCYGIEIDPLYVDTIIRRYQ
ncbi:MAG: site-specific DNA-methyltransferase, partial [Afipia sp.]|nr:site-specific DNA-methyltransferase [Afipia sp.]